MADAGREPTRAQEPGGGTQGGAAASLIRGQTQCRCGSSGTCALSKLLQLNFFFFFFFVNMYYSKSMRPI